MTTKKIQKRNKMSQSWGGFKSLTSRCFSRLLHWSFFLNSAWQRNLWSPDERCGEQKPPPPNLVLRGKLDQLKVSVLGPGSTSTSGGLGSKAWRSERRRDKLRLKKGPALGAEQPPPPIWGRGVAVGVNKGPSRQENHLGERSTPRGRGDVAGEQSWLAH